MMSTPQTSGSALLGRKAPMESSAIAPVPARSAS